MKAVLGGLLHSLNECASVIQRVLPQHYRDQCAAQGFFRAPEKNHGSERSQALLPNTPQKPRSLSHNPFSQPNLRRPKRPSHDVGENKHERLLMWQENTGWCLMYCKSTHLIGWVFFRTFSTQMDGRGKGRRNASTLYTITRWVLV